AEPLDATPLRTGGSNLLRDRIRSDIEVVDEAGHRQLLFAELLVADLEVPERVVHEDRERPVAQTLAIQPESFAQEVESMLHATLPSVGLGQDVVDLVADERRHVERSLADQRFRIDRQPRLPLRLRD